MRVDLALLCDSVTVREGLLHILGGGVTRIVNPGPFPQVVPISIALRMLGDRKEMHGGARHEVQGILSRDAGEFVAKFKVEFGADDDQIVTLYPGEEIPIAIPISMGVELPGHGGYAIDLVVDGVQQASVPFWVVEPPGLPTPRARS